MEDRSSIAVALRLQAAALLAFADALESESHPATPTSELIAIGDAGLPIRTLRAAIRTGALVGHRIGRSYFIDRLELARWLTSRRVKVERVDVDRVVDKPRENVDDAIEQALSSGRLRVVRSASRK